MLNNMQQQSMKVFFITAINVAINSNGKLTLKTMQKCSMNVLCKTVTNVIIKEKQKYMLNNMYQHSMRVFFITTTNVVMNPNGKLTLKVMQKCRMKVFFIAVTSVVIFVATNTEMVFCTFRDVPYILMNDFYHLERGVRHFFPVLEGLSIFAILLKPRN